MRVVWSDRALRSLAGIHEALAASALCAASGLSVGVIDMPSIDEALLARLCQSGKLVCLAEQNNGYILQNLAKLPPDFDALERWRVG